MGKRRFTVVCMENNIIINSNNKRINSVFHILTTVNLLLPTPVYLYSLQASGSVFTLCLFAEGLGYGRKSFLKKGRGPPLADAGVQMPACRRHLLV